RGGPGGSSPAPRRARAHPAPRGGLPQGPLEEPLGARAKPRRRISQADGTPARMSRDLATIWVLLRRDLVRFFRQRSRVLGAFAQPVLFWLLIGGGLSGSFTIPGSPV